ncbi:MAG: DUF554 domain-containing protein [Treponema sp.]|uniref:DUF554 domain-containing protein n=1 Tax=Treponema sp. TaxID=166 RepID=UPI001B636D1A|nr:DUF554 domain-containing protein [Treponema sp.]MBP5402844.1 DUF554 domain-containing protein [Treponema sp.]MBR5933638.1 DUF554 domain-containing protein [Treponema sp.]
MVAVFVNCIAVIIGSLVGIAFSKKVSGKMTVVIQDAAGIITVILGLQMAFQFQNIIYLSLSLLLGGIIGSVLDIDGKILGLGNSFEKVLLKIGRKTESEPKEGNDFGHAFLNASCLFCVGAMSILGSFDAGIRGNYTVIFTKSILDGFMAITFAASMGIGTLFSFVTVLVYQGALTLLSGLLQPYATEQMLAEITGCGGAMIMMIGVNLLGLKKIKTANYLPAIIFVIIFVLCDPFFKNILGSF